MSLEVENMDPKEKKTNKSYTIWIVGPPLPKEIFLKMCNKYEREEYERAWKKFLYEINYERVIMNAVDREFNRFGIKKNNVHECAGFIADNLCQILQGKKVETLKDNMAPYIVKIIRSKIVDWERDYFKKGDRERSYEEYISGDKKIQLKDVLKYNDFLTNGSLILKDLKERKNTLIKKKLTPFEYELIRLYDEGYLTVKEIAEMYGIKEQKIYDIKKKCKNIFIECYS